MNEAGIKKLLSKDKTLAPLIKNLDFPAIQFNENLYASLIEAIINQQLSVAAARTIHTRFLALFKNKVPGFKALLAADTDLLRSAGISNQKAGYLKNIAQFGINNTLNYHDLKSFDDEALIVHLTQIKGVGRWTVEMILMFNLERLNVFPLDDIGIQNAIKKHYQLTSSGRALKLEMEAIASKWKPYRSIACMYLWRSKDLK